LDLLRRRRRRSLGASPSAATSLKGHLQDKQQALCRNVLQHFARAITIVQEHWQEELPSLSGLLGNQLEHDLVKLFRL
jgi:hypothetical protein